MMPAIITTLYVVLEHWGLRHRLGFSQVFISLNMRTNLTRLVSFHQYGDGYVICSPIYCLRAIRIPILRNFLRLIILDRIRYFNRNHHDFTANHPCDRRSIDKTVPRNLREASFRLGAGKLRNHLQSSYQLLCRVSYPGCPVMGRVIGESANSYLYIGFINQHPDISDKFWTNNGSPHVRFIQ